MPASIKLCLSVFEASFSCVDPTASGSRQTFMYILAGGNSSVAWSNYFGLPFFVIILLCVYNSIFFLWRCSPTRATASSFLMTFLDHTQRRTTVGRTPLVEWSARRRDLYLTTHNTHNRQTSMPPVGFEPTIPAGERPQTYALDRAATGTGWYEFHSTN